MMFHRLLYQSLLWRSVYLISLFLLNIFLSRLFGAGGSGWIFYLSGIFALFILLCSFSLEAAMGLYYANKQVPASHLFTFAIAWTFIAGIVTWCLAGIIFSEFSERLAHGQMSRIATSFVTGNLLISFFTSLFYAEKRPELPNVVLASVNLLLILVGVLFYYSGDPSPDGLVFIDFYFYSFLAAGLIMAIAFALNKKIISNLKLPSAASMRLLFRYSLLAFSANLISFILFRIDYFFVNRYCNENDLGNYIQVSKITQLFFVIPGVLASAVFPLTAGGQREEVNGYLPLLSRVIVFAFGTGCLLLAIAGKWLFPAVFGESFQSMYFPFLLMIPGILAICLIYPVTSYYAAKNRVSENIKGALIATIFLIAGDMIVVPDFGINGAALICSLSYILYGMYMTGRFSKEYKIPVTDFFVLRKSDLYLLPKLLNIKNGKWS